MKQAAIGRTLSRPAITNQLRYAFQQSSIGFYGGGIPGCTISVQGPCSSAVSLGAPLTTYGYDLGGFFPQGRFVKINQIQDNASITKGRHTILFGGEFDYPGFALGLATE